MMTTIQKIRSAIVFLALAVLVSYGMDWLNPILEKSAFFNGFKVVMGVLALPFFALLLRIENDPRPFSPTDRFPRILMALFFFTLSISLVLWGLIFWFPGLQIVANVFFGVLLASGLLLVILVLRADRANQKAKKAPGA